MAQVRPTENRNPNGSTAQDQNIWEQTVEATFRGAPSWLLSLIVHVTLLILLALTFFPEVEKKNVELDVTAYNKEEGEPLDFRTPKIEPATENPAVSLNQLPPVDDPLTSSPIPDIEAGNTLAFLSKERLPIGLSLDGRKLGNREKYGDIFGMTPATESAVEAGLKWLAKNQKPDGYWSLQGPYRNGGRVENREAATAMAMLAFQGAGYTHRSETKYQKNVDKALRWLLKQQDEDGCFFKSEFAHGRFYTHAQVTIVLCELYAITKDQSLREPIKKAIDYLLFSQSELGGWKYYPKGSSDTSVTGWVVMALQSARMGGIDVPDSCWKNINRFLDSVATEGGSRYGYELGHAPTRSMTAEALLCRQYLGWKHDDDRLRRGVEWLTLPENLIDYSKSIDVYYWYYATQVMHHIGGDAWQRWNKAMSQEVPAHQVKGGREAGSWVPDQYNSHDLAGGRLYVTCLSLYMLEVYYRHLPIYREAW